ncbi:MAG: hypothetical protein ACLT8I_16435 [Blautia faecis]
MLISALLTARVDISSLQNTSRSPWKNGNQTRLNDIIHPETLSARILKLTIKRRSLVDLDGKPRMPKAPKGYYVDPESIEVGINPITHYAYRHYTLIKIKKRE